MAQRMGGTYKDANGNKHFRDIAVDDDGRILGAGGGGGGGGGGGSIDNAALADAIDDALRATALNTTATLAAASVTSLATAIDTALRATPLKTSGPLGGSASAVRVDVTSSSAVAVAARATRRYVTLTNPPRNTAKVAYAIGAAATLAGNPNLEPGQSISIQTVDAVQMIADAACKIDVIEVWA